MVAESINNCSDANSEHEKSLLSGTRQRRHRKNISYEKDPQNKSKKQRKQNAQNGGNKEKRVGKKVALDGIREQFNPFEFKMSGKAPKFEVTTNQNKSTATVRRPGVAKGLAEERLTKAYEEDMRRRKKVGGIVDKRFGENDPSMAPEEKMLERFTLEKQRHHKHSAFDLEDDDMGEGLTHMGKSLSLDAPALVDDFDEAGLALSDAEDHPSDEERQERKRRRSLNDGEEDEEEQDDRPERKKSKQEVMTELIAKSKLHKYERQQAKDDDEDLREELDKELSNIHALLRGIGPKSKSTPAMDTLGMNPDRAAMLTGADKIKFDKEYDLRLRQMAQDKRSKPTERTKTEDERIAEESRKLQQLEEKRQRRMHGEPQSSDEEDINDRATAVNDDDMDYEDEDEDEFGLGAGIKVRPSKKRPTMAELGVEDEDDFLIDDDLVASGSDVEEIVSEEDSVDESLEADGDDDGDQDADFLEGLLTEEEAKRPEFLTGANAPIKEIEFPEKNGVNGNLAYTFKCPESHEQLLEITKGISLLDLPTVVQRIRALYHPKLNSDNKSKLSIGTVFPTSDHFHQVVTPALLTMGRYLALKIPQNLFDYAVGAYMPLAIKTSIPKFEETFNPDKHYDADRDRAEAAKLRKEYKQEKKGAMRELRKDAAVVARESLREKRERDAAYEKKYKRLIAEIQGEEGREQNTYAREKEWRKKGKK
ncbi:putative nucleolar complex protein 14 [Glarea lozoyensis 74030]|uniref:Putative nucleolar complex protein 14 n=1 Tax=Glarea lozoyensis (strain ATCC 74030 / MF5533) TaxID=1104152 RepID=H0ETS6_GLAL7|nr:putative nucleolar complex protein 14 [Glarea lozoyensis 74030]